MVLNFRALAVKTAPNPPLDVCLHTGPNVSESNLSLRSSNVWMGKPMEQLKNRKTKRIWKVETRLTSRKITDKRQLNTWNRDIGKGQ